MAKKIIYQVFPRYFGNDGQNVPNGSIEENGCGKFADFTDEALKSIADMGCTHIWYTGVLEHATKTDYLKYGICRDHPCVVKGNAGSPYAIKDYYDIDPDLAVSPENRLEEFDSLIDRTHQAGLKVLIDFVPNHVARQYHSDAKPEGVRDFGVDDAVEHAFNPSNNFYYIVQSKFDPQLDAHAGCDKPYTEYPAKATGNDCFSAHPSANDWYETVKLNYGVDYVGGGKKHFDPVPTTWFKMLDILIHWSKKGVDGFRCDMAEMVPVEFWGWVIPRVKKQFPNTLFIAEVYQTHLYWEFIHHGQFDYLYDKEGMYNTVRAIVEGHASASNITQCWQSVNNFQQHMLCFLENHDEQRIASDFFAHNPQKALPGMFVLTMYHQNPIMLYAGQELGEQGMYAEGFSGKDGRSSIFDYWSIETLKNWKNGGAWNDALLSNKQKTLREAYVKLFQIAQTEKAIAEGEFFDLQYANTGNPAYNSWSNFSFMRKADNELLLGVANFSDTKQVLSLRIPIHAFDCMSIPQGVCMPMTELITGTEKQVLWSSEIPIEMELPAYGSVLFKGKIGGI